MKLKPIKDKKKIEKIFSEGEFVKSNSISAKWYNFEDDDFGFGISVPKKLIPSAVRRNKIKRRIKSVLIKSDLARNVRMGIYVFLLYGSRKDLSFSEIQLKVVELLKKLSKSFD
tara:strand:+ start:241 stop:582 length:342 start_codon:yes stop_codon:yes gene_type:complete